MKGLVFETLGANEAQFVGLKLEQRFDGRVGDDLFALSPAA
jgi:hypothetical protein